MVEDDIYHNKRRYEKFINELNRLIEKSNNRKYYCKNSNNIEYFKKLHKVFERNDNIYIRRLRLFKFL